MVRYPVLLIVVVVLGWPQHPALGDEVQRGPATRTALLCSVSHEGVAVIGGLVAGHGWVDSDQVEPIMHKEDKLSGWEGLVGPICPKANPLMHKGDRLSVYALGVGHIGEAKLTDDGTIYRGYEGRHGIEFSADLSVHPDMRAAVEAVPSMPCPWTSYPEERLRTSWLARWSRDTQEPQWLKGQVLSQDSKAYRRIVEQWLTERGVPRKALDRVITQQIVRCDINRDGRNEVFISFETPEVTLPSDETPREHVFSYLLMRYLPSGAKRVKTVIIAHSRAETPYTVGDIFWVDGFCDVDGDGVAEVVVHSAYYEGDGAELMRWVGDSFVSVAGWMDAP